MRTKYAFPILFSGRWQFRLQGLLTFYRSLWAVTVRRMFNGPMLPGWSLSFEVSNDFLKRQTQKGFQFTDHSQSREYEDAVLFTAGNSRSITKTEVEVPVKGAWYSAPNETNSAVLLYLHGGGYAYYSKAHDNLIGLVVKAINTKTFALEYRLTPEYAYPAQLEDALAAYRWLVDSQPMGKNIIVAGDSAGGNLVLSLLIAIDQQKLPAPKLAICISPWTDVTNTGDSMRQNERFDWVTKAMADKWAQWYCAGQNQSDPLISPVKAKLTGLPPIYIQAGSAEILIDMIRDFDEEAKKQKADVTLEVWENMTHDFQAYGDLVPESKEALIRLGEIVRKYCG